MVTIALVLYYIMLTFVARRISFRRSRWNPPCTAATDVWGPDHGGQDHLRPPLPQPGCDRVQGPPNWNRSYKSIRSDNTAVRWMQNALSFVGFIPPDEATW